MSKVQKIAVGAVAAVVIAAAAVVGYTYAYPSYTLKGTFKDAEYSQGVSGIKISGNGKTATTNNDGYYELKGLKKDSQIKIETPAAYKAADTGVDYTKATKASWNTKAVTKDVNLAVTDEEQKARVTKDLEAYYQVLKDAKWETAYDMFAEPSKALFDKAKLVEILSSSGIKLESYKLGETKMNTEITYSGKPYKDVARVSVNATYTMNGENSSDQSVEYLVKEAGHWRPLFTLN